MHKKNTIIGLVTCILLGSPLIGCADTAPSTPSTSASPNGSESTGQYVDDATITAKIKTFIVNDEGLKGFDINVKTFKGVVQLSGFVDNQTTIERAIADAKKVDGIVTIENSLIIPRPQETMGEYIDDATTTAKIKAIILKDAGLKGFDINVKTYKGVVQLSGFVDTSSIAEQAVADARKIPGVRSIVNSLIVKSTEE